MEIGIGLPAAVPGTAGTAVAEWAVEGERRGFASLAVLDRLVYDNLDPIVALAAAAARTERVELLTTILGGVEAGRTDRPRIVAARYFCLGARAGDVADEYLEHYYGAGYAPARADTLTTREQLHAELARLAAAGCDDALLFPCSGEVGQVALLAAALA